jgi:DNA-binding phage protein
MRRRRILAEVHETAAAMHRSGSIDGKTMREFEELTFPPVSEAARGQMAKKLTVAMEDRNPRVFLDALAAVIEEIGFGPAVQRLGVTKARLARVVGPKAKPSFEEVRAVVSGLGFRWGVARRLAETRRSKVRAKRRRSSEHDTKHITPAGRSVLLDLALSEEATVAAAKGGGRESRDLDDAPQITRRAAEIDASRPRRTTRKRR